MSSEILIDGITLNELLVLLEDNEYSAIVFIDEPIIFKIGTANLLAQVSIKQHFLELDISHIDGGGEGVLPLLNKAVKLYCSKNGLKGIKWYIYATNCVNPNPKLKRILELKKYKVIEDPERGSIYFKKETLEN